MKKLGEIFELLDSVLPSNAERTVMFCEIEQKSYEIFYYSYFADGSCKQCYELESEGKIAADVLEKGFEKIAAFIRDSKVYEADKRNVITVVVSGVLEDVKAEQFEKNVGLYKIKKDWKSKNL